MDILSVNNFRITTPFRGNSSPQTITEPKFGLTMAKPLLNDTVSFKAAAKIKKVVQSAQQTTKTAGKRSDGISLQLARMIRNRMTKPHTGLKKHMEDLFKDQINLNPKGIVDEKKSNKYLFTLLDRIKSEDSIIQKTASRGWGNLGKKELLVNMTDISGLCFVLEDKKSLGEFVRKFSQEIRNGKLNIVEAEYHRLAPFYTSRTFSQTFDSLDPSQLQKLKRAIYDTQNPVTQIWKDVDSMSGYSGLHLIVKNTDGTMSEIQVMTRAMHNLKNVENLFYKIRNNKDVDPKYRYFEQFMAKLKVKDKNNMTEEEIAIQKALKKYTQEAYEEMLNKPFDNSGKFLSIKGSIRLTKKEKEMLKDYDFNKIGELMKTCESIATH